MKTKRIDLVIGQQFGQWAVVSYSHKNEHYQFHWNCKCSCGYESIIEQSRLVNGRSTKCKTCANALRRRYKSIVLNQKQYGKWLILREDETDDRCIFAQCECGNSQKIIKEILLKEQLTGCGICRVRFAATKHGHNTKLNTSAEYRTWRNIKTRIFNPKNNRDDRYAGRGITMAPQWVVSFSCFLQDAGFRPSSKHSLDRINNDGNYEPGNVRWVLPIEQVRNRSITFKVNGEYLDIKALGKELKVHPRTIKKLMIKANFSLEDVHEYSKLTSYQKTEMGKSITQEKPYLLKELLKLTSSVFPSSKRHPLWSTWHSIRQRCNNFKNRDFDNYGARGIQVCDEWATFRGFQQSIESNIGVKPSSLHQLDRIDNNGNYEIENVRWSTSDEQSKNKRTTMYINGVGVSAQKLALQYKISSAVMGKLIKLGWTEVGFKEFEQLTFKQKKHLKIFVGQLSQDVAMQKIRNL